MVRVVLGDNSPQKSLYSYILKNNCTKFGAFVCFVPISSKFTTKQLDYRQLATHCDFGDYLDQVLRDRLVCGIHYEHTQECLLLEVNLTLEKAIEGACNFEVAEAQTSQLQGANKGPVMPTEHMKRGNGTRSETSPDKRGKVHSL